MDPVRETVFEWFKACVVEVWGKWPPNLELVLSPEEPTAVDRGREKPPASLSYARDARPMAVGRHLISYPRTATLRLADRLLVEPPERIRKILLHEAVHLGYPGHGADFRAVAREVGATVSESGLDDDIVQVQKKVGARFQTVKTFPGAEENAAVAWAKEQLRAEPGSRWRTLQGYEALDGQDKVVPLKNGYELRYSLWGGGKQISIQVRWPETEPGQDSTVGAADFAVTDDGLYPENVWIADEHQGKGLASAVYALAERETGEKIVHSATQTVEGQLFRQGRKRGEALLDGLGGDPEEYGGRHRPPGPGSGAPLHDLTEGENAIYPDDVYGPNAVQFYGTGEPAMDRATIAVLHRLRGKPDANVVIYRALPCKKKDDGINPGDWVTVNRQYAEQHAESTGSFDEEKFCIVSKSVPAREVFTNGDSIHEAGYWPS